MSKSSSNKKYSGFISSFEPARSKKLLRNLEKGGDFSDSFSIDDWELDKREIFLLVLESNPAKLNGAAFVERSYGNGGTGKPKFSFSNLLSFGEPILIANIENQSGELSALISNFSKGGKRLEDDEWAELVSIIKRLRPGIASDLDELISLVFKDADLVDDTENRIMRLAEQRDAIGMATDIAGCDRKFVMKSINATDAQTADSILDLIEDFTLDERSHVEKDSELIRRMLGEDLDKIKYKKIADENDRKVTVFVIDKTKLETVLGTDLLIYQSLFKSFILVQYKLMDYIKKGTIKGWSFMPDTQLHILAYREHSLWSNVNADSGTT